MNGIISTYCAYLRTRCPYLKLPYLFRLCIEISGCSILLEQARDMHSQDTRSGKSCEVIHWVVGCCRISTWGKPNKPRQKLGICEMYRRLFTHFCSCTTKTTQKRRSRKQGSRNICHSCIPNPRDNWICSFCSFSCIPVLYCTASIRPNKVTFGSHHCAHSQTSLSPHIVVFFSSWNVCKNSIVL